MLPTLADCYSLVAMEAMSCGLPVVISRLGGIPEIVAEGETGFLLEPGDYPPLPCAWISLVSDAALRQRMGEAALARAREQFDCRVNLGRILDVMKAARQPMNLGFALEYSLGHITHAQNLKRALEGRAGHRPDLCGPAV